MMNGGYKIIDLKRKAFTSGTEQTVAGIYDQIEETAKRIILSGLVIGTTEYRDMEVNFHVSSTSFKGYIALDGTHSITIVVADDDGVTVTYA